MPSLFIIRDSGKLTNLAGDGYGVPEAYSRLLSPLARGRASDGNAGVVGLGDLTACYFAIVSRAAAIVRLAPESRQSGVHQSMPFGRRI